MKEKLFFAFGIVLFLLFVSNVNANYITKCTDIVASGTYIIENDFSARNSSDHLGTACIYIDADNVTLDFNNHIITNENNSWINEAVRINDNNVNIKIKSGTIRNFTKNDTGVGIYTQGGWTTGIENLVIENMILIDNDFGIFLNNVSNSQIQAAIDQPLSTIGLDVWLVRNSTFSLFTRANTFGAVFRNMSNSTVTGHFDTDVIITRNESTWLGTIDYFGLLPASITTTVTQTQSKGIALMCWNCSNNLFIDISAIGLIQGIDLGDYSTRNILGRISLPLSGTHTGGQFGGVWLGENSKFNILCEIDGNVKDYCEGGIIVWPFSLISRCDYKSNVIYESCSNIFDPAGTGIAPETTISTALLTPLLPNIQSEYYSFVSFLTTPFFLVTFLIILLSLYIAKSTNNATFGLYTLMFLIIILTAISFTTFWVGFIFAIVIGFILYKTGAKDKNA